MKIAELDQTLADKVSFELRASIYVPRSSGCYVLSNMYEDVLYIGQTGDLRRRMEEHLGDPRITQGSTDGLPSWFVYRDVSPRDLYPVEQHLLSLYKFREGVFATSQPERALIQIATARARSLAKAS